MFSLARLLIRFHPKLLYRENAAGQTPAELAHDQFIAFQFPKPKKVTTDLKRSGVNKALCIKPEVYSLKVGLKQKSPEEKHKMLAIVGLSGSYSDDEIYEITSTAGISQDYEDKMLGETRIKENTSKKVMWDLCQTAMKKHTFSRRLASLHKTTNIASRLNEQYAASGYFSELNDKDEEGEGGEEEEKAKQKKKKEEKPSDFSTMELAGRLHTAWRSDGVEHEPVKMAIYCEDCATYHSGF
ncbi:hypothetical protein BGZ63DRAFT_429218 [Mariannaea sp. PMI_226]|nr:hypothetical protein BGZ63DRAFT_429218 [Mariannaea sp. PMI_226]